MTWTTPKTWVASEFVDASEMNTHVRDNLSDLQTRLTGAGTSFTLITAGSAGITIGNATQANSWKLLQEKFAFFRIHLVLGSTSSVSGTVALGPLPFTVAGTDDQIVAGFVKDVSAAQRWGGAAWMNGTQAFRIVARDGTAGIGVGEPMAWATSDEIIVQGVVEIT
jgi:hypothetical protein